MLTSLVLVASLGTSLPGVSRDHRVLCLAHAHDGARLCLRPFDRHGRLRPQAQARLSHFLRSRRSGLRHRVHPQLVRSLVQLQRRFRAPHLDVFSAYRAPVDPGGPHGYHGLGRAVDLRIPTASARDVFEYCRGHLLSAGCGLYPNTAFVHVDARPRPAIWVDLSTRRGNVYVKAPADWLRRHPGAGRGKPAQPYTEDSGPALDAEPTRRRRGR